MTDYSELKSCIAMLIERGEKFLPFEISSLQELIFENEKLRYSVELHERNAKLMEKSLTLADRSKFQKEQKVCMLENQIAAIRLALGRFCWVADYPNDDSPEFFDNLHKDAERYRWLRDKSEAFHQFYLSTPIWFTGIKFNKENVDCTIDAAMAAPKDLE